MLWPQASLARTLVDLYPCRARPPKIDSWHDGPPRQKSPRREDRRRAEQCQARCGRSVSCFTFRNFFQTLVALCPPPHGCLGRGAGLLGENRLAAGGEPKIGQLSVRDRPFSATQPSRWEWLLLCRVSDAGPSRAIHPCLGPASESLQGRNARAAVWAVAVYGDLTVRRLG